ncbi:hypothetical protein HOLleu_04670 [Holothuria leucospilota]|uniref:Uncharacterized protein n=1 Tax=Holothuria leucospilota TaxID=206669 RepID=A0A9Q1HMG7_HOLLE|nr:hypothetical protein HOLleu_04670 [Holothuria leucospilota]
MGRKLRTTVPENEENLSPKWQDIQDFREKDLEIKREQKETMKDVTEHHHCHNYILMIKCGSKKLLTWHCHRPMDFAQISPNSEPNWDPSSQSATSQQVNTTKSTGGMQIHCGL